MGKEEMKNKISMALKDPVLQIGFEIICKNLSELEKKNEELKNRNAELAGQKASLGRWLGEAIAIIKGLLESCFGPTSKTVNYEIKARAEQFLKEADK